MTRILKPLALSLAIFLAGCSSSQKIIEAVDNERAIVNECKNSNINVELDCYD